MKEYKQNAYGELVIGGTTIPKDPNNRMYAQALAEVDANQAVIVPYSESAETVEQKRIKLKEVRDSALEAITHDLGGGRVMQVRPGDAANLQMAIQQGQSRDWVMADNTVQVVTIPELQGALASGISQAAVIWQSYMDGLKSL